MKSMSHHENWHYAIGITVDKIKDKLNLPSLTLRICFADFYTISYATPLRKQLTRTDGMARVARAYMRIWKKYIVENDIAIIERRLEKKMYLGGGGLNMTVNSWGYMSLRRVSG